MRWDNKSAWKYLWPFHGFLEYRLRVLGHGMTKHLHQPGIQSGDVGDFKRPGSDPNGQLLGIVTEGIKPIEIEPLRELFKHIVYGLGDIGRGYPQPRF